MMFLWQRLIVDLPRGGDGGGGNDSGGGGGFDAGTAGDIAGFAGASAAGETTAGVSMGDAASEAAGNIAGTSGGADQAAANAEATGNAMTQAAFAGLSAAQAAAESVGAGPSAAAVSPTVSVSAPAVETTSVQNALGNTSFGGFGLGGVTGGVAGPAGMGFGGLGAAGMAGAPSSQAASGVSPSVSTGSTGLAALGDTGPQGFAASESGFSPSTSATDVSGAMGALGLGDSGPQGFGSSSSLAAAAAGGLGQLGGLGTSPDSLADLGIADPTGFGAAFTGPGTGSVSLANAIGSIGAGRIGAYSGPAAQTPTSVVGMPTGNQAFSVGLAPSTAAPAPAPSPSPSFSMSASQLASQLGGMAQPSAQPATAGQVSAPSVSSYGFSSAPIGGAPGLTGTVSGTAPSTSPTVSAGSSLAAAAAGAAPGRSASSFSQETFADPLTGAPVSVTTLNGQETVSLGASPVQGGIGGLLGSPTVSTLVNTGLSLAVPSYGLANLASLGLTGTSLYGQALGLATGQGFQTGGGLLGAIAGGGPTAGYGTGASNPNLGGGEGGGGGSYEASPTGSASQTPMPQYTPVEQQIAETPLQPIPYNVANFGPVQMPGYRVVPTPSPAFAGNILTQPQLPAPAYFAPQGYPTNPPIPTFYSDYVTREAYRAGQPSYYT